MTGMHECSGEVYQDRTGWFGCSRNATIEEGGKWWCWQHAPSREAAKKRANNERVDKIRTAFSQAQEEAERRAAELTEQLGIEVEVEPRYSLAKTRPIIGFSLTIGYIKIDYPE